MAFPLPAFLPTVVLHCPSNVVVNNEQIVKWVLHCNYWCCISVLDQSWILKTHLQRSRQIIIFSRSPGLRSVSVSLTSWVSCSNLTLWIVVASWVAAVCTGTSTCSIVLPPQCLHTLLQPQPRCWIGRPVLDQISLVQKFKPLMLADDALLIPPATRFHPHLNDQL